jgi:hypothetical protein
MLNANVWQKPAPLQEGEKVVITLDNARMPLTPEDSKPVNLNLSLDEASQ